MSNEAVMRNLFDRWELVWHEGQFGLIPECVAPNYLRHDEAGDRTVTREAYAAEIAKIRQERPAYGLLCTIKRSRATAPGSALRSKWTDPKTGEARSRTGMQAYRIEDGKLAKTRLILQPLGSAWNDAAAQAQWTSPPPGRK
jgi:hypothetical protein